MTRWARWCLLSVALAVAMWPAGAQAGASGDEVPDAEEPSAAVEIDGKVLFSVRGSASFPAEERAKAIAGRIVALARDRSLDPRSITVGEVQGVPAVLAGERRIIAVFAADAGHESMSQAELAATYLTTIREAISTYREERSSEVTLRGLSRTLAASGILVTALLVLWRMRRRVELGSFEREWAEPTYKLARIAVVGFALVVAYPYIPGSSSAAFKGVSLFAGVVFSLGSSTAIANVIAGYSLTGAPSSSATASGSARWSAT